MKKFFEKIAEIFKKFMAFIKKSFKKFIELVTNKWLLKGTTTVILVALVIVCYAGISWGVKQIKVEDWDFTTKKLYTLSDETKSRLKELEEDINIQIIQGSENVKFVANQYKIISEKIKIEEIDNIEERVDLQETYNIEEKDLLIIVKGENKQKVLFASDLSAFDYTTNKTIDITEEVLTNAIMEVTLEELPKIYVLSGKNYYEPVQSMYVIANALMAEANEVATLDILVKGNVPEDCDCLIITTLKQDLSDLERDKIFEYINNGGKILMLTSQSSLKVETPNFDQILAYYGAKLDYGVVVEQDESRRLADSPNYILTTASADFLNKIDMNLQLLLVNPGSIKFESEEKLKEMKVGYEVIATTGETSFVRTDFDQQTDERTDKDSEIGSNIVAARAVKVLSEEDKYSELIIFADEKFASTSIVLDRNAIFHYNNKDIALNSISYLTERRDTIIIRKADEIQYYTVTDQQDVIIKTIIFTVPVLIIGMGVVVWAVRRRKF